jgi:hypothetical protein
MGRVQVSCPAVLGDGRNSWALPSTPYAGAGVGLFLVPPEGANVWVEFEAGDPDQPIWAGCFWGRGEAPAKPALASTKLLKTENASLRLDDLQGSGGITIEVGPPAVSVAASIKLTSSGLEISCAAGKIKLSASGVSVNDGALEVF